jgi:cell division protein FtsW (lipid II flippase)
MTAALARGLPGIALGLLRGAVRHLIAIGLFMLTMGVLVFWLVASQLLAGQQQKAMTLSKIMIRPASAAGVSARETVITLGRKQLLQNEVSFAAAERHIRIHRLRNGVWKISNASANRQLLLEYADGAKYLASRQFIGTDLTAQFSTRAEADQSLKAEVLSENSLRITHERRGDVARVYEIALLSSGVRLCRITDRGKVCEQDAGGWAQETADRIRQLIGVGADRERNLVRFGGSSIAIQKRIAYIAMPDVVFDGLRLVWVPRRGFAFAPGRDRTVRFAANGAGSGAGWSFFEVVHDLAMADPKVRLRSFVAGRTRYEVDPDTDQANAGALKITPVDAVHRTPLSESPGVGGDLEPFEAPNQAYAFVETAPPASETWKRTIKPGLHWWYPALIALLAVIMSWILVAACHRLVAPYRWRLSSGDLFRGFLAGVAIAVWWTSDSLFSLPKGSASPIPPYAAILAWAFATLCVFVASGSGNHMRLTFAVATAIVATGSYTMLALGLSSDELRWSRFHNETVGTIALGAASIALFSALPTAILSNFADAIARPGGRLKWGFIKRAPFSPWLGMVFVVWIILAIAWFGLGSETGIPGLGQPSEAMKSLFIVIGSSVVTLMVRHRFGARLKPSEGQIFVSVLGLTFILLVQFATPVISHDFSPFLILALTSLLSFFIIMLLHICATWASRLSSPVQMRVAPFVTPGGGARRLLPELRRRGGVRRVLMRTAFWPWRNKYPLLGLVGVPLVVAGLAWGYLAVLKEPAGAQAYLLDVPENLRKPAKRLLSWIELDLIHPKESDLSEDRVPVVEFPDIGLQVMRSRESLESAPCRIVPSELKIDRWLANTPNAASSVVIFGQMPLQAIDDLLGKVCPQVADGEPVAVSDLSLPEIQNDFIAAWAIHALGRDGAFALALLQFALVCLMTAAAFRVMRWRAGDEDRRAASTFLAGAIVGFALMLLLQFSIAWMNAFGLLPVMGQPMTFVSHGRSHFLFFGIPAIMSVMIGLRFMRSEASYGFTGLSPIPMSLGRYFPIRRRPTL